MFWFLIFDVVFQAAFRNLLIYNNVCLNVWCLTGHFCTQYRLNGASDPHRSWEEVKDETSFRHDNVEIWTQMVNVCGQPLYQLENGGAPVDSTMRNLVEVCPRFVLLIHLECQVWWVFKKSFSIIHKRTNIYWKEFDIRHWFSCTMRLGEDNTINDSIMG